MEEQGALSPSMLVPLRMLRSGYHGDNNSNNRQLAVVPPTTTTSITTIATTSRFKLPKGWGVKKVLRSDASRIDKYYHEPETGYKFRSLKEVERYIETGVYTPRHRGSKQDYVKNPGYRKMIISDGKMLRLDEEESNQYQLAIVAPTVNAATSRNNLPDGWVVEEVPRRCTSFTDKYYYEPGTGQKFRSLIAVEKHLAELEEYNAPLSKAFKLGSRVKNSGSWKKNISGEKAKTSTFISTPMKVNWVLASPGGDTWNPFICEMLIPESVKQQWAKRFMLSINERKYDAPYSASRSCDDWQVGINPRENV